MYIFAFENIHFYLLKNLFKKSKIRMKPFFVMHFEIVYSSFR